MPPAYLGNITWLKNLCGHVTRSFSIHHESSLLIYNGTDPVLQVIFLEMETYHWSKLCLNRHTNFFLTIHFCITLPSPSQSFNKCQAINKLTVIWSTLLDGWLVTPLRKKTLVITETAHFTVTAQNLSITNN
jgi:hypothetical protein